MDELDKRIVNALQEGFPICAAPYKKVGAQLGISESTLLSRLQVLLDDGTLSRFGPMYHAEVMGGGLSLAAVKAPAEEFDRIAEIINAFPEVAHNYERDHVLNMWFVLATETPEQIERVISQIEQQTALKVYNMPKIREYFVGLRFNV
jgi:siroheme decarboxylase